MIKLIYKGDCESWILPLKNGEVYEGSIIACNDVNYHLRPHFCFYVDGSQHTLPLDRYFAPVE